MQQAATELFREHDYARTTASAIAARAGVTERTFFRHAPDKREVLFNGQAVLAATLTASIADAPIGLGPLDTLFRVFRSVTPLLDANRPFSEPLQQVVSATPALQERESAKLKALCDALAHALEERGVTNLQATLTARAGNGRVRPRHAHLTSAAFLPSVVTRSFACPASAFAIAAQVLVVPGAASALAVLP